MTVLDWDEAPEVRSFYGRGEEVDAIASELLGGDRRLIVIQGMKGLGKTCLALGAVRDGQDGGGLRSAMRSELACRFDHVVWRSLLNAPPVDELLRQLAASIPAKTSASTEESLTDLLLRRAREARCLIVLDNLESLLEAGEGSSFRPEAGDYEGFLTSFARTVHGSCIVVTTRETPERLGRLCGPRHPGVIHRMIGLDVAACGRILDDFGVAHEPEVLERIARAFGGNPLALELTARRIKEVHGGDAVRMLETDRIAFREIRELLDWHFGRLPAGELRLAYCLAVAREPLDIGAIASDLGGATSADVGDAITSIQRKLPLETRGAGFTLHAVLMEYATDRIVAEGGRQIEGGTVELLDQLALCKATSKDFVRGTQRRLLLAPLVQALARKGGAGACELSLEAILGVVRATASTGFAAGNVFNLMQAADLDLRGRDFSGLTIRSAHLQESLLHDCDFSGSAFSGCVFATTLGSVLAVAVDPQGEEVVSGDNHGDVRAWRISDAAELRAYEGHRSWVRSIAFAPDGLRFATGSSDYEVRIWDKRSTRCLQVLKGHVEQVYSVAWSKDDLVASGAEDGKIILWSADDGSRRATLEARAGRVRCVRFDTTGATLAVAAEDLEIWDVRERRRIRAVRPVASYLRRAVFAPCGTFLACVDDAGAVHLVDAGCDGEPPGPMRKLEGAPPVNWLDFSSDGTVLAAAGAEGRIARWSTTGFERFADIRGHPTSIRVIAFGSDPDVLVSGGEDRAIRIWNLRDRQVLHTIQGYANGIRGVAWNVGGGDIAAACEDGGVRLWSSSDPPPSPRAYLAAHSRTVESVAFDARRGRLASTSDDGTVRLWEPSTGRSRVLQGHRDWVWCSAFDSTGRRLATGGRDRRIIVWDASTGAQLVEIGGHDDEVHCVVFADADRLLVSGGDDSTIRFWDSEDGRSIGVVDGHRDCVRSLAFNQVRGLLASASDDASVKLWTAEGDLLGTMTGHVGRVRSVAFGPCGARLYSAGDDAIVRAWNADAGTCIAQYEGHEGGIWSIAVDGSGKRLVSGSEDGTIRVWDLDGAPADVRWPKRRYEGMLVSGATGIHPGERSSLRRLGAIDEARPDPDGKVPAFVGSGGIGDPYSLRSEVAGGSKDFPPGTFAGRGLVVAVANYDEARPLLPEAVLNDARDMAEALSSPDVCGFPRDRVTVLLDGAATLAALRNGLARLAAGAGPDETVFIYFSGHGARLSEGTSETSVLLTVDSRTTDLPSTAMSEAEFSQALKAIRSRRLVIVLDACHSGGAGTLKEGGSKPSVDGFAYKGLSRFAGAGRAIMASSLENEVSWIAPGARNSLFTGCLLEALRGGARSSEDGLIRILDVIDHVAKGVQAARSEQHPIFRTELQDNFPIAFHHRGGPNEGGPPASLRRPLSKVLADLYREGPGDNEIWSRAGGDLSRLTLGGSGLAMWHSALRLLRRGGGGADITIDTLVATALDDFPDNFELEAADQTS